MKSKTFMASGLIHCLFWAILVCTESPVCFGQEYGSSVVGTDFDFIVDSDPSCFESVEYQGLLQREMPDKTADRPLHQQAFVFLASFTDGTRVDIAVDDAFENQESAKEEALRYATRLGKLPTVLRKGVNRIVVHQGHEDATAFSDVGLIVIYSANATKRISTHDLEETLFHESVHAAWDKEHAQSARWRNAVTADGQFMTAYARKNPDLEDLAESALFAYVMIHHPQRIPQADAERILRTIPARIRFVEHLIPLDRPIFFPVEPDQDKGQSSFLPT